MIYIVHTPDPAEMIRHAEAIRIHFRAERVITRWTPGDSRPIFDGDLLLTTANPMEVYERGCIHGHHWVIHPADGAIDLALESVGLVRTLRTVQPSIEALARERLIAALSARDYHAQATMVALGEARPEADHADAGLLAAVLTALELTFMERNAARAQLAGLPRVA